MKVVGIFFLFIIYGGLNAAAQKTSLFQNGMAVIPCPKEVKLKAADLILENEVSIVLDREARASDRFAAEELKSSLAAQWGLSARIVSSAVPGQSTRIVGSGRSSPGPSIRLTRTGADKTSGEEGYTLSVSGKGIVVRASGPAGLYYGVVTLMQCVRKEGGRPAIREMELQDWPDTRVRAVHYDTKHHQDSKDYVEHFIKELSRYKINMLIWEWEDKFEYPSHPEIGAPGAFTMQEMQELTRYAQKYHVQIVPLVQGLGHVSFILKWPQFAHLRELPASNFEFCPLKEESYKLLSELWQDAIRATPGSEYIHIGSDETYELGACPDCKKKVEEIGKSGLYHLFVGRSGAIARKAGRQVMAWESPMGWEKGRLKTYHPDMGGREKPVMPLKGLILTESYDYETPDLQYAKEARAKGFPVYAYDPNPGIEQLFLPYFFSKDGKGDTLTGSLENSFHFLQSTMGKGVFDGVIRTSWDDSGLPMESWILHFAATAAYSWNAAAPSLPEFTATFYRNRYGPAAQGMDSLYRLLNEAAYFFMESWERRVWAWGEIGKSRIPDLPRGDALEYDPFWNTEYKDRVRTASAFLIKMDRALGICDRNLEASVDNRRDITIFRSLVNLTRHTALTYLDLSRLEVCIRQAHEQRYTDTAACYGYLQQAEQVVKGQLARRDSVFKGLVALWEQTRLPKGMSTAGKPYFFEQDRTRHFANRAPDMGYLIMDEDRLGLAAYLEGLQKYMLFFRQQHK